MSLSEKAERDKKADKQVDNQEKKICSLVDRVRDFDCELSFEILKSYLAASIKVLGRKYNIPGYDSDAIEQECLYALRYKAIEDFDEARGKFRSFAILCITRHLFSVIKASNQNKRRVLNESLSLHEDRSDQGESLSLINVITEDKMSADDEIARNESHDLWRDRLLSKLSKLEQEVLKLYLQQFRYDEIVESIKDDFPDKNISKKSIDNALQRIRAKAESLITGNDDMF